MLAIPIQASSMKGGTAAAPGAGSNFVALDSAPKAGRYRIKFGYVLTGTQETAALNIRLKANGLGIIDLPTGQATAQNWIWQEAIVDLDGTNVVAMGAIAAATGGSVYTGVIICDRLT